MSDPNLTELERDVEAARVRLAADLSVLRSPATLSEFGEDLKHEAMAAKDALVHKARSTAQATALEWADAIKARAAANPAAVLLIGAGVAWRLIRHPPIATALIGAGLCGLLRSQPVASAGQPDAKYIAQARTRLREQAGELTSAVKDYAAGAAAEVTEQTKDLARAAGLKAQQWTTETQNRAREVSTDLAGAARASSISLSERFPRERVHGDTEVGDRFLLAAAGLFVAAALGIAYQRR